MRLVDTNVWLERLLLEHFGEEYRAYMTRTARLIPRLWR